MASANHRRAHSHNVPPSLPIEWCHRSGVNERNRTRAYQAPPYSTSDQRQPYDRPRITTDQRPSQFDLPYDEYLLPNSFERKKPNFANTQRIGFDQHRRGGVNHENGKEDANYKLNKSIRKDPDPPASKDRVTHGAIHSRQEQNPIEDWLLNSSHIDDTRSTSTETVVDDKALRPSQSYFRSPQHRGHRGQSAQGYTRGGKDLHWLNSYLPAHSNTSTETVVADNRFRNVKDYDPSSYKERGWKIQNAENRIPQERAVRSQQAAIRVQQGNTNRIREEARNKALHDEDFSAFLREEFQKVPERMKGANKKWPGLDYGQAIGKAFLSESSFSFTGPGPSRTAEDVPHPSYRDAKHRRFKSTGLEATNDSSPKPGGASHWAYSGLPINRSLRNPIGVFLDQVTRKHLLSAKKTDERDTSENLARIGDLMEYKACGSRGSRPPSPDWIKEYAKARLEPEQNALSHYEKLEKGLGK
ncbi:hypothetical protein EV356DRAFT_389865 [Viridothelium virens]|uniref:Uncharacterized protein n=1 Tax=Viridothelium virens TaxID=1048519 RepID=A0A6A6GUF5_VIRVR|nr:hypothetical protein EV356DRAFT_389865 [Viridothelium virens]